MEKKTIGKFISVLRRAKGMTQKELGERLFVSDKTVSRWECDECTPELSLIPTIAEIFGVTTDELLRGERNASEPSEAERGTENRKAKRDKQVKLMLHSRKKKYSNLSFVSIGLAVVGLIVAMICNLAFSRGLLGFCLASIFFLASVICQLCVTVNFRLLLDEDETEYAEHVRKANTDMVFRTVKIFFGVWILWAFCLPIAVLTLAYFDSYYGLLIDSWLLFGTLFAVVAFVLAYCIYRPLILPLLIKKEIVFLKEEDRRFLTVNNKLIKRLSILFASVFALIMVATYVLTAVVGERAFIKRERFNDPDEFIEYMQTQYDEWYAEGYPPLILPDGTTAYPNRSWGEIDGKEYYYNADLYHIIDIGQFYNGEYDIVVTTKESYQNGTNAYNALNACLLVMHIVNFGGCIGWYCFRTFKRRNSDPEEHPPFRA